MDDKAASPSGKMQFETQPAEYRHWTLSVEGEIARLIMEVEPFAGQNDKIELKSNSYDLSVDIELADAVQRLPFTHPEVKAVVVTSAHDRIFCAGANIYMLASASHPFKVNFCKYTNETRLAIEEASAQSGQKYLAACNGATVGRGVRAGPRLRRHRARRRWVVHRGAARGPAPRRASRYGRAHPRRRQAQGAPRPGGRLFHTCGGREGKARTRVGAGRRRGAAQQVRRRDRRACTKARRERPAAGTWPRDRAWTARAAHQRPRHRVPVRQGRPRSEGAHGGPDRSRARPGPEGPPRGPGPG